MIGVGVSLRASLAAGKFSPRALFALSEPGVWYDPSDLNTMFQDRAGTTLVTTPGQSVGLVLDKRLGLTPGPELVTDPASPTLIGTGTYVDNGNGTYTFTDTVGGQSRPGIEFTGMPVNKYVRCTVQITAISAQMRVSLVAGGPLLSPTAPTTITFTGLATSTGSFRISFESTSTTLGWSFTVSNISVREIPGNHMVATADASRGTYGIEPFGGRRNLLTFTEQFNNAVWVKSGGSGSAAPVVTPNAAVSPVGDNTADLVAFPSVSGAGFSVVNQLVGTGLPSATIKGTGWVKAATAGDVGKTIYIYNSAVSNLLSYTLTADWQRIETSALTANTTYQLIFGSIGASIGGSDQSAFSILLWGAQLEVGSTATPYQRVTTAFDVTEAGVPTVHYVQFDGADDGYLTSTITPGTDKAQVFAGVRKLLTSGFGLVAEFGTDVSTTNGSSALFGPFGASNDYGFFSRGTALQSAQVDGFETPITNVLTGLGDISGDRATLRINGSQVAQSTADQGTGNYLAYPLYIGRRGGTTLPFNGRLYQMVVRFGPNLDAARIQQVERFMAGKTGFFSPVISGAPTIGVL
jgi:hypothetical protein